MNVRLLIAILTSLLDELAILAIIIWGLPRLGIEVPRAWLVVIVLLVVVYAVLTYRLGSRALARKPLAGLPSMVGLRGIVVRRLGPEGMVRVMGETWQATAEAGPIEAGAWVLITGEDRLKLIVRPDG